MRIANVPVDIVDRGEVLDVIAAHVREGQGGTVFTPNVDHIVRATHDRAFSEAYGRTKLALADGKPIVWTAQLSGYALRDRVTGADLFLPLLERAAKEGWKVHVVGGRFGAAEKLLELVRSSWPTLPITVGAPTRAILAEPKLLDLEVDAIRLRRPDIVLVCLGSPLQETWSDQIAEAVAPSLLFGLGSAMDVAVGMTPRAPGWMQRNGLEWLYRLASDPRRLWRRYLVDDVQFAPIFVRTVLANQKRRRGSP